MLVAPGPEVATATDLATGARVAVGHVGCALFVAHQNVMDLAAFQRVIGGQNSAAGVAKDLLHAFALETFPENAGAGHCLGLALVFGWGTFRIRHATSLRLFSSAAFIETQNPPCQRLWRVGFGEHSQFRISQLTLSPAPRPTATLVPRGFEN